MFIVFFVAHEKYILRELDVYFPSYTFNYDKFIEHGGKIMIIKNNGCKNDLIVPYSLLLTEA